FMGLGLYLLDKERFQLQNASHDDPNLSVKPVLFSLAAILKLSVPDSGKDLASWMGAVIERNVCRKLCGRALLSTKIQK
ncbi:hypothetical protein ACN2ZS_003408, partial [Escherichia coli]